VQSCGYVASCWPSRLWRMFWAVSGQFAGGSDSGSGKVSGNLTFGQGFPPFAPCTSDVVTANISKHQLSAPSIGKKRFSATAECNGVFAQHNFGVFWASWGRFREGTWLREPVPGSVFETGSRKWCSGPEALFRVQKVASPRFRRFWCSMGSEG